MPNVPDTAKPRYVSFAEWVKTEKDFDLDPIAAQVAVQFYPEYQRSDANQEAIMANRSGKLEAAQKRLQDAQERAERQREARAERERVAQEKEEARVAKAQERADREAERSAADASAPKRGRKPKASAEASATEATDAAGEVVVTADGQKRSEENFEF